MRQDSLTPNPIAFPGTLISQVLLYRMDPRQRSPKLGGQREKGWDLKGQIGGAQQCDLMHSTVQAGNSDNEVKQKLLCLDFHGCPGILAMEIPTRGLPAQHSAKHEHSSCSPTPLVLVLYVRG